MAKAIGFENGEVWSAIIVDPTKKVCKSNLTDFVPCPKEIMNCIEQSVAHDCKLSKETKYLYLDGDEIVVSNENDAE